MGEGWFGVEGDGREREEARGEGGAGGGGGGGGAVGGEHAQEGACFVTI